MLIIFYTLRLSISRTSDGTIQSIYFLRSFGELEKLPQSVTLSCVNQKQHRKIANTIKTCSRFVASVQGDNIYLA